MSSGNTLPISIQMGALPPTGKWTPQQLADLMVARMSLVTANSFALFVSGSTEPTSNVGPWLKDGLTWMVWSNAQGKYIEQELAPASLGYWIGPDAPDPDVYHFWIETAVGGSPLSIKIFYSGGWVDVYAAQLVTYQTIAAFNAAIANYSTTTQMNAAIAAAIAALPAEVAGTNMFKARPTVGQDIVFGGGGNMAGTVDLGTEDFDPDGVFAGNAFTVPAGGAGYYQINGILQANVTAGSPTDIDTAGTIAVNGVDVDSLNNESVSTSAAGRVQTGSTILQLADGDIVTMRYNFTLDAAGTIEIDPTFTRLSGCRLR